MTLPHTLDSHVPRFAWRHPAAPEMSKTEGNGLLGSEAVVIAENSADLHGLSLIYGDISKAFFSQWKLDSANRGRIAGVSYRQGGLTDLRFPGGPYRCQFRQRDCPHGKGYLHVRGSDVSSIPQVEIDAANRNRKRKLCEFIEGNDSGLAADNLFSYQFILCGSRVEDLHRVPRITHEDEECCEGYSVPQTFVKGKSLQRCQELVPLSDEEYPNSAYSFLKFVIGIFCRFVRLYSGVVHGPAW